MRALSQGLAGPGFWEAASVGTAVNRSSGEDTLDRCSRDCEVAGYPPAGPLRSAAGSDLIGQLAHIPAVAPGGLARAAGGWECRVCSIKIRGRSSETHLFFPFCLEAKKKAGLPPARRNKLQAVDAPAAGPTRSTS